MLIAQITDMHVTEEGKLAFGQVDTAARLAKCVARIVALDPQPDAVLATGDLVNEGTDSEYAYLKRLLSPLKAPVYLIPGNHDHHEAMRRVFADADYLPRTGLMNYAIEHFPLRILALDTTIPGHPQGRVEEEHLAWLAERLREESGRPTIVMMHHPPFETGIEHMDAMACEGAPALASVIAEHPEVERILCGHVHRPVQVRFAGTIASIGPSTAFQVALDLRPDSLPRWTNEPPAFQLHYWSEIEPLASHIAYSEEDDTPHPFTAGPPFATGR